MRAALQTGRHDGSDLHRHLGTRLHPRYGESAVWVSSQCDVLTNEFPALKPAAWQMPFRNSAHIAEYAFVNDLCEFVRQWRISPRSGCREIARVIHS